MRDLHSLRHDAREIFNYAMAEMDAGRAVRRAVNLQDSTLRVGDIEFDLRAHRLKIYAVALGKAAGGMASALEEVLGMHLAGGVISATGESLSLSKSWRVFAGGHPLPNEASIEAARAALTMLRRADSPSTLVIFLISGGGSAMLELLRDARITLADLREANRLLVQCGARIAEINHVRRALSQIKGGGLSAAAPYSPQASLIVSDTSARCEADVASGPTIEVNSEHENTAMFVVEKYNLVRVLPLSIVRALREFAGLDRANTKSVAMRKHFVLLDNERAITCAAAEARARGYVVEVSRDIVEQHVAHGSAELVSRLVALHRRHKTNGHGHGVCLIAGGEFSCPVRGTGVGGRNAETALRCTLEMDELIAGDASSGNMRGQFVALCAGTDGIDGNSPAAGALADHTTIRRARALNLSARQHLEESDAYTFFERLGDALVTGATGTNVRDLRILLAS